MANKGPMRRLPVCKQYLMIRNQALRISPSNFTQFMTKSTIYGVVVDMPMQGSRITTLACYINGATNLYFGTGGDYSGAAQRYPGLVQATRMFVANAANYIELAEPADTLEVPPFGNTHYAYLLTTGGIYRLKLEALTSNPDARQQLFMNMYKRVMSEIRAAQLKDKAAGITPAASSLNQ